MGGGPCAIGLFLTTAVIAVAALAVTLAAFGIGLALAARRDRIFRDRAINSRRLPDETSLDELDLGR